MNKINKKQFIKSLVSLLLIWLINLPILLIFDINYRNIIASDFAYAQTCTPGCSSGQATCPEGCELDCGPGIMAGCPFGSPVCYNPPPAMLTPAICKPLPPPTCDFCSSGQPLCCSGLTFSCPSSGYQAICVNDTQARCFRSSDNMIIQGTCVSSSSGAITTSSSGAPISSSSSGVITSSGAPTSSSSSGRVSSSSSSGGIFPPTSSGAPTSSGIITSSGAPTSSGIITTSSSGVVIIPPPPQPVPIPEQIGLPPNPPILNPLSQVRSDLSQEAAIPTVFFVEGFRRNRTPLGATSSTVTASDPDTPANDLMTFCSNWRWYDSPRDLANINNGFSSRWIWTQNGPNGQPIAFNLKLTDVIFNSGIHTFDFSANDGMSQGTVTRYYLAVDDPGINDRPYIKEIPQIILRENDETIINLDKLGLDPDRNNQTIGRLTYSIVSVKPEFTRTKLCGVSKLTNNENYILTIHPQSGDSQGGRIITVTLRATDNGGPPLSFDRDFTINVLPQTGTPTMNNPENLPNCFTNPPPIEEEETPLAPDVVPTPPPVILEPTLNPDAAPLATITSIPKIFNPGSLDIPQIIKGIKGDANLIAKNAKKIVDRVFGKERFKRTLIIGGRAYLGIKLNPQVTLSLNDLNGLKFVALPEFDNNQYAIPAEIIAFDSERQELSLEVNTPENIPPGDARFISIREIDGKQKLIAKTNITFIPPVITKHIKTKALIGKPQINSVKVLELPSRISPNKKQYALTIEGENFAGKKVLVNETIIKTPIANQPFTLITFTNNEGITVQRIRVSRLRTKMRVLLLYEDKLFTGAEDIRLFTISTLHGQTTGKVNLKDIQGKMKFKEGFKLPKDRPKD